MFPLLLKLLLLASGWFLIWLDNAGALADASAALVAMAAPPLALWLGMPWRLQRQSRHLSRRWIALAAVVLVPGLFYRQPLALSCGWTICTGIVLAQHLTPAAWRQRAGLLPLGLLSLPWLGEDLSWLSMPFRSSGAWVAERCFDVLGFDVVRAGTRLIVEGQEISVEPACAGMNGLHAMLVAGAVLGWLRLRENMRRLVFWLAVLPAIAWLTNTLRIITISMLGLHTSPEMVAGTAHEMIGWTIVLIVFGLSSTALDWLPEKPRNSCL
ncbi:exosortase/archaeosortase family protein [Prosthecobacter sp.]|uniref:exosortase/archaeosortase family protein n=1 Tax=Prosthecobacter sp. TaxID=1965333 RepID=UPI003783F127